MKKSFFKLSVIFLLVASLTGVLPGLNLFKNPSTVQAIGDLTVNWGVPEGSPIFTISNMAPGQVEQRIVHVSNGATSSRPVAIKGIKTGGSGSLENVLNIEIKEGAATLYNGNLNQFFQDTTNLEFIPLSTLGPGGSTSYTVKVTFDPAADNAFQETSVIFNLIIGIAFDVPAECENIVFSSSSPIFGTAGNNTIHGTQGNDLIIALEGNDKVFGKGGNDCILGGEGSDQLRGELGDDVILGEGGNDLLIGSLGNDKIFGGSGNDQLRGEVGNDFLDGGENNDTITGGVGNDEALGGEGNDNIKGEAGNDDLTGGPGTDIANGNTGTDTCDAEVETSCEL